MWIYKSVGVSPVECPQNQCFPCIRINGQKSPWFVDAGVLAIFLDQKMEEAQKTWKKMNE